MKVYHGTSAIKLQGILKDGVTPPSFWTFEQQAYAPYAYIEEQKGNGGAVISVEVSGRQWYEQDKNTFEFIPLDGSDDDIYENMVCNSIGIVCLETIAPGDIEVVHFSEPLKRVK